MKKSIIFSMLITCLFLVSQCTKSAQQLTEEFSKLSLIECAEYYRDARTEYDSADKVFSKVIMPQLETCRFKDLQQVRNCVVNTPVYAEVDRLHNDRQARILSQAETVLNNYANYQKMYIRDSLVPAIVTEVRNTKPMQKILTDVIKDYKGWFGKIFDSTDDFQEEWDEKITPSECQSWIKSIKCLSDYKNIVNQEYEKYCDQQCPEGTRILSIPDSIAVNLEMPKDIVGAWIVGEQDKTKDKALGMLGDFVVTAVSNKLTKQKTTVYDAGDAIFDNSINNSDTRSQNKSDDEKLAYMLSESLLLKIIQGSTQVIPIIMTIRTSL